MVEATNKNVSLASNKARKKAVADYNSLFPAPTGKSGQQVTKEELITTMTNIEELRLLDKRRGYFIEFLAESDSSNAMFLLEIKCSDKTYQVLSRVEYDENGKTLEISTDKKWRHIIPDTNMEGLFKAVCK